MTVYLIRKQDKFFFSPLKIFFCVFEGKGKPKIGELEGKIIKI